MCVCVSMHAVPGAVCTSMPSHACLCMDAPFRACVGCNSKSLCACVHVCVCVCHRWRTPLSDSVLASLPSLPCTPDMSGLDEHLARVRRMAQESEGKRDEQRGRTAHQPPTTTAHHAPATHAAQWTQQEGLTLHSGPDVVSPRHHSNRDQQGTTHWPGGGPHTGHTPSGKARHTAFASVSMAYGGWWLGPQPSRHTSPRSAPSSGGVPRHTHSVCTEGVHREPMKGVGASAGCVGSGVRGSPRRPVQRPTLHVGSSGLGGGLSGVGQGRRRGVANGRSVSALCE